MRAGRTGGISACLGHAQRGRHRERAPLADNAGGGHIAPEHLCELARDAQAKAGPAECTMLSTLHLPERIEDVLQVLRRDTSSRVADRDDESVALDAHGERDAAP